MLREGWSLIVMATITRENIGPLNDKLIVKLEKSDYIASFEKSLKTYAKSANIPGFRKGMVPPGLVKKMYGQGIFGEEVIRTVDKKLNDYLVEEKLAILAQPIPLEEEKVNLDVNQPADYEFAFEIGLQPDINIDVKDIKVTRYKIDVTDQIVDEEIERLQIRNGKQVAIDAISDKEDIIGAAFAEADKDGNAVENGFEHPFRTLKLDRVSGAGFELLNGKKKDETITAQLNQLFEGEHLERALAEFGFEKDNKEAAEKFATITINSLHKLEKAAIDETFFEAVYPKQEIKTEEAFRAKIKESIEAYFANQASSQLHDQLYHHFVDHTALDFPKDFLTRWLQVSGEKQKSAEDAEKEYPQFAKQLQWALISSKLVDDNNITVEKEEIKDFARQQLLGYLGGQIPLSEDASWMDEYAERMLKDKKFVEDAYAQIRVGKLFQQLEHQVQAKEESISEKDFSEKLHHHHH